jgi:hypothetical protein
LLTMYHGATAILLVHPIPPMNFWFPAPENKCVLSSIE